MITIVVNGHKARPIGLHRIDSGRFHICGVTCSQAEVVAFPNDRLVRTARHSRLKRGTVIEADFRSRHIRSIKQSA